MLYPNLFNFDSNSWIFYFVGTSGPEWHSDKAHIDA